AGSYRLQVDQSSGFSSPVIDLATGGSSYQPASDLAAGLYYWRVRADKVCGTDGDWSSTRSFVVETSGPPGGDCEASQVGNSTVSGTSTHGACGTLSAGPSLVVSGSGDLTLEAGRRIVFLDGFAVEGAGSLRARACGHSLCEQGTAFAATCHSCVAAVCAQDSFCCGTSWDGLCVNAVGSVCGLSCP
ncbi:MAG TPA: hypothetical protein VKU40_15025, partial [Thermoanaerobaculia bacterium]|nr:hypothetical protein [Thermoanaerobaculia bacterium]